MTFDDILPPHMITNAQPSPDAAEKQKKRRRGSKTPSSPSPPSAAERPKPNRHSAPPSSSTTATTMTTMEQQARSPSKRNYPSGKKLSISAGGGRMRATARMLVRGLSVVKMKRDSRGRGGYEAV
jgi:hypothetical protein